MAKKKYLKRADSKAAIQTYTPATKDETVYPDFSYQAVINMVNDDPVARGAINHFVDKFMEGDMAFLDRQTLEYKKNIQLRFQEKYKFRTEVIRKVALQLKLWNNAFIEVVRDTDGRVKSLNVLDAQDIKVITEPNGDPIEYRERNPNPQTGEYAKWTKEEVVWIKNGDRSIGYAPIDLRALWETLLAKSYVKRYVAWLWQTGQYRVLYNFKTGATDNDIDDFLTYLRRNDDNFKQPFPVKGEMETKILRDVKETDSITQLLKYYDSQTLILLRVPPIDAGIPDASGRSNSDAQSNNLSTTITSMKQLIADAINYDLFKKMNVGGYLIRFAPNDRFSEKMVFENLQIMQSLGMTNDVMEEYLQDKGIVWDTSEVFKEEPDLSQAGVPSTDNPRDLDTMPSRQGKSPGEANQKHAEPTSRPDQVGEQ